MSTRVADESAVGAVPERTGVGPLPGDRQGVLLVTDVRFWRSSIGSQLRVTEMVRLLREIVEPVHVLFLGQLTDEDERQLAALPEFGGMLLARDEDTRTGRLEDLLLALKAGGGRRPDGATDWLGGAVAFAAGRLRAIQRRLVPDKQRAPALDQYLRPDWAAACRACVERLRPSALLVEIVRLSFVLDALDPSTQRALRAVVDTHDVMWRRHLAFSHAGLVSDLAIDARAEGAQLAKFDSVIAIQGADAAVLREMLGATPVHVVHHPSPIEPLPAADRAPLEVAFVASGMSSNVDGMRQFAQEIWPLVQSDVRQAARVAVYGGVCNKLAAEALPADVELRGFADDLRAVYRDSAVIINPVNAGGGLKIKTVEALCYGRCLVTTPSGAEGLEDGAGTAFLMAHTSAEFAALLEHALRERDFREGIARGANDYARTHFARDVVRDSLARAVLGR